MKNLLMLVMLSSLLISCSSTRNVSGEIKKQDNASVVTENDGSSYETAIVIREKTESKGVSAEYAWLRQHYPGYRSEGQLLSYNNDKPYDIIHIVTANNEKKTIYFDISNFFGKF